MHFQLRSTDEAGAWNWTLEQADGTALACAPKTVYSEQEARKQIAAFRKAAGGVKFAKVLSP